MPMELSRGREGVEAVLSVTRLLMLDDLWTAYLDHADPDDIARDLSDLEALVADMSRGLAAASDHVKVADEQLENTNDEEVTRAVDRLLQDQADDWTELRDRFMQDLAQLGVRRSLMVACKYVGLASELLEHQARAAAQRRVRAW
jgi:hypothetical protein